jgi:hypothetical protein
VHRVATIPTAPIAASGLIGGYAMARFSGRRELGGILSAAVAAWCARQWARSAGPTGTAVLLCTYFGGLGASHPLAKKLGAWPSVFTVAAASAAASYLVADRVADGSSG